jgi:hypothetical protein
MDKIINYMCKCSKGLPWKKGYIKMVLPCEHLYHENCVENDICYFCKEKIEKIISLKDKDIHYQHFADLLSMSNYDTMSFNTSLNFIDSIFDLLSVFTKLAFTKNKKDGKDLCNQIFSLNNLTLSVYGLEKIELEKKKVFICNHVSYLEFVVIYYLFNTGFLASSIAGDSKIVQRLRKVIKLLTFQRGVSKNVINEIKNFVDENGSICLFPEGILKHPDTLTRFRTGAFYVGYPVYAITIRHNNIISDGNVDSFLYKLCGKKNINMEVHVLGPYYPPFNDFSIEKIRRDMGKVGKMILSRVCNRDIVDKKNDS